MPHFNLKLLRNNVQGTIVSPNLIGSTYEKRCTICYRLYSLEDAKNTHGCLPRFLNCTNGNKLRNVPHYVLNKQDCCKMNSCEIFYKMTKVEMRLKKFSLKKLNIDFLLVFDDSWFQYRHLPSLLNLRILSESWNQRIKKSQKYY